MRGFLQICFTISVFLAISSSSDEHEKEQGYCEKTDKGVTCVSDGNVKLTRLDGGEVGDVKTITVDDGRQLEMKTFNTKPLVFEIEDFLTDEECEHFISVAKRIGMKKSISKVIQKGILKFTDLDDSKTVNITEMLITIEDNYDVYFEAGDLFNMFDDLKIDSNKDDIIAGEEFRKVNPEQLRTYLTNYTKKRPEKRSRLSERAWLKDDLSSDKVFQKVQKRVSEVVDLPLDLVRLSDFQATRYGEKGHYNAHLDSSKVTEDMPCCKGNKYKSCRDCRYMTVQFYLNDVTYGGETAFPYADKDTIDHTEDKKESTYYLYRNCEDVAVQTSAKKRKAIIWYNHFIDEETGWTGEVDEFTLHTDCPVYIGEKWIANLWIKTDTKSLTEQRMKQLPSL